MTRLRNTGAWIAEIWRDLVTYLNRQSEQLSEGFATETTGKAAGEDK
ncbi:hypothetical protein P7228_09045 [Altererythrobacter arenosus]|uniref:Transposase n=1 Tax=Altererythrobacter arenosus TaxID=3032592 RepID=A0ABY8FMC0_9SPHN|nr:hypothetical protein [Altererythrobacter sp. CAU 1644]WFL76148.1 hypothetical protein P7228_09045 [Altererythrobacter sp. CAU 1644]